MHSSPHPDFAVVGAGLTGLALAYGLARTGRSVVVVEQLDETQVLQRPGHALLWAQGNLGATATLREWNNLALARWCEFDFELGQIGACVTHYERPGGVWLAADPLALQGREMQWRDAGAHDPELEWLDRETLGRLVHRFSADLAGASYCADDGQLSLQLLHRALHRALKNLDVEARFLRQVERVSAVEGGYELSGEGFELRAQRVVFATGGQSPELAQMSGFEPLHTVVETLWETEQVRNFLPFPAWQLRQSRDGSLLLPVGAEGENGEVWRTAVAAYPPLAQLSRKRVWQDTRCETADGLPSYQRSPLFPDLYRVASPDDLLHCPLHASVVAAWLCGKLTDQAMAPLLASAKPTPQRQGETSVAQVAVVKQAKR